jgi:transcription termination/antitermination protein NusA
MMKPDERVRAGQDLLRGVDLLHREKNIPEEVIFSAIEKAIRLAILKRYEEEENVSVAIDRKSGVIQAQVGEKVLDPEELGRIPAQAAKQQMIQMFREEESNSVFNVYQAKKGDLVQGTIQRFEGGAAIVSLDKTEAILPRSEQIPGETHHVQEKVKAVIMEVKKVGHRVKIILSRTHPDFVRRLFEREIPEIDDHTIEMKAIAREAGYRTKVAVSSIDMKVDCVGACVGVRGSRIKNIVEALGGERIDIVRWNDSLQVLIPNALQPAQIEEVFLYPRLGRAVVLVKEDQLSLAIGRRGQNVRLASKLVQWDIEIMTHDELNASIDKAVTWFLEVPGMTEEMVEVLIEEGFLSYDDLTFLEPAELGELVGVSEDQAEEMIAFAEEAAEQVEQEAKEAKAREAAAGPAPAPAPETAADKMAKLFPEPAPAAAGGDASPGGASSPPASEGKQAFEDLFRPVEGSPAGEAPPEAAPAEQPAESTAEQPGESATGEAAPTEGADTPQPPPAPPTAPAEEQPPATVPPGQ